MMKLYTLDNKFIEESDEFPVNFTGFVYLHGSKYWYLKGMIHRLDGPAIEWSYGTKEWYANGQRHRLDGPAVVFSDGGCEWFINGVRCSSQEHHMLLMDIMKLKGLTTLP